MWGLTSQPVRHSDKFWREIWPNEVFTAPCTGRDSLFLPMPPRSLKSAILTPDRSL